MEEITNMSRLIIKFFTVNSLAALRSWGLI